MKTANLLVVIMTMCFISCTSSEITPFEQYYMLDKDIFVNGPVKKVTATNTLATMEYGGTASIGFLTNDFGPAIRVYELDEMGNVTSKRAFRNNEEPTYIYNYVYEYNQDNTVNTSSLYVIGGGRQQLNRRTSYEYKNGKIIKVVREHFNNSRFNQVIFNYDYEKGRLSKQTRHAIGGELDGLSDERHFIYEKDHLFIEEYRSVDGDDVFYDIKTGRIVGSHHSEGIEMDKDGRYSQIKNAYADSFDLVTYFNGHPTTVSYKYNNIDKYNNWTERITYWGPARETWMVTKRTFEYYE